jgi:hypothetical protein
MNGNGFNLLRIAAVALPMPDEWVPGSSGEGISFGMGARDYFLE